MNSIRHLFLAALTVAGCAGASQAAIVRYDYQGAPLFCGGDPEATDCGRDTPQPGFFGQVTIDTTIFGASGPAFFDIAADRTETGEVYSYRAANLAGAGIARSGLATIDDVPFFVSFSGSIGLFLQPGAVGENSLSLSFDTNGAVTGYFGSDTDGGSTDSYISDEGDSTGGFGSTFVCEVRNVCTFEPGTWTRTVIDDAAMMAPAPVPLPAGILLLGAALAALGTRAGRRISHA